MKDLSTSSILQLVQEWIGSFMGKITVLMILAIIDAGIIMAAKESYGKDSFGHRVVRFVAIAVYAILAFNFAGTLIAGLFSNIGGLIMHLLSIKWLTTTILVIIYIIGAWISFDTENIMPILIATIILIGGSYGIYQTLPTTIGFGVISGIITFIIVLTIED